MDPKGYGREKGLGGGHTCIGGVGTVAALVLALFLSGCVTNKILEKVDQIVVTRLDKDLEKTVMLAEKYGKDDLAKCAKYLRGALAGKRELLKEETAGLISRLLKIKLIREFAMKDEEGFKAECGSFAAGLMLELGNTIGDGRGNIPGIR